MFFFSQEHQSKSLARLYAVSFSHQIDPVACILVAVGGQITWLGQFDISYWYLELTSFNHVSRSDVTELFSIVAVQCFLLQFTWQTKMVYETLLFVIQTELLILHVSYLCTFRFLIVHAWPMQMCQVSPKLWTGSDDSADLVKIRKLTERVADADVSYLGT